MNPQEQQHLDAAEGWLGLGNWNEANEELEKISPALRSLPDVLAVRFRIFELAGKWQLAIEVAGALCKAKPKDGGPCVYLARALHGLGNTKGAVDFLTQAAANFPQEHAIPYDLACYCCELEELGAAAEWLKQALHIAGTAELKLRALEDPKLEQVWKAGV